MSVNNDKLGQFEKERDLLLSEIGVVNKNETYRLSLTIVILTQQSSERKQFTK